MRLCSRAGAPRLLPVLVLLTVLLHVKADQDQLRERHYYIAAVEVDWNYSGNGPDRSGPTYKKVVFREYEEGFKQAKTHPAWLGLLGPTLRGQEGETIVVTFRNMADRAYSIHPHGIAYGKQSEGAQYFDNTSLKEKEDDVVQPNCEHTYYWEVTSDVAPQRDDPTCITYTYISHQNMVQDFNSGLIGTLLICKPGSLDESGQQARFHQESVFLFGVFDEKLSWYEPAGHAADNHVKYTVNGYTSGSLPDVSMCAHTSVSLHLMAMSSEPEVFSVHMNGQVLQQAGHKVASVGLVSGSATTASVTAVYPGRWLLSSHTASHLEAGMHGFVDVKNCEGFEAPRRRLTIDQRRHSKEWPYYIAAEEIVWNYAPNMPAYIDEDYKSQYLKQGSNRIGGKYRKVVYTQYTDETFTVRAENKQRKTEVGILGPVIRAQIRDVVKIVFKNMASRPYSIYPHGLTIEKSQEGFNYPAGGNQSHGVQPGKTHTYEWKVVEEDEPLDGDSRCLTRLYHSAVDTPRDIASGLIGPLLICKSQSLNVRNVQLKADKEQHAMFAVFDENKSWYLDENIRSYCDRSRVNKADPDFYKSNVMHTINGYVFESGQLLGFCNGEIATWHVSSIGAQDYIQTATFYGHTFELNERTEDFLSLYPMTGETISMNMDNIGVWLLASLNSHETTKGMRVKFQDVECFRDYVYEYTDYETDATKVWKPPTLEELKKEQEKPAVTEKKEVPSDDLTEMYIDELGLRSLKTKSRDQSVEELDLSFLDYDVVGHAERDTNITPKLSSISEETEMRNGTTNPLNYTLLSDWQEVDELNSTAKNLNQSISENTMYIQKRSATSDFHNSSVPKTDNTTVYKTSVLLKDDNITTNGSAPLVASKLDDAPVPETENTTVHNTTVSLTGGNLTTEATNLTVTLLGNVSSILETERTNVTQMGVNQASVNTIQAEKSEEKITRGDVFSYSVPVFSPSSNTTGEIVRLDAGANLSALDNGPEIQEDLSSNQYGRSEGNVSLTTLSYNETAVNNTATNHLNMSEDGTNQSRSIPSAEVRELNISSADSRNLTSLELEVDSKSNTTNVNDSLSTTTEQEYGNQTDSPEAMTTPANSSFDRLEFENDTSILTETLALQNITVNISEEMKSESGENVTALLGRFNHTSSVEVFTNETVVSANLSLSRDPILDSRSEELGAWDSSEEVVIYLKGNSTEVIKTTSLNPQGHNWTYEGTHQMVPMEIPVHMTKYFGGTPQTTPTPTKKPNIRKVNRRQRPQKGHGMKTKRKKEYQPQAKSGQGPGVPFSPRGFNPGMSPRGSRPRYHAPQPISDEEDLINTPVVIGVPRADFSDYVLYAPGVEPDHLGLDRADVKEDEYEYVTYKDPYSSQEDISTFTMDETTKYYIKMAGQNVKTYFISAEEVEWDYAGYGQRRQEKSQLSSRETKFTKVVFRGYLDAAFRQPDIRGEIGEHLGILGPIIKAEVGQSIMVVFRNNAKRPYSLHPNGVSYTKQAEGLSYEDESKYWYKYDNEVQPNTTFTYLWKVDARVGPMADESYCRTWAYYSGVNPERDIHSGLIGPLLVCRKGNLEKNLENMREFVLLFKTFDESQSWYYEKNRERMERKSRRTVMDPNFRQNLRFHSINGIIYSLKGLRMYTNQLARWHLINMGSPRDFQSVHFHGQTFLHKQTNSYRQAVYPLLPGGFATLEMWPSKPGLWLLESEIGFNQQKGMQTLFLVLDNDCSHPLGLGSGSVKDNQITAVNTRGYWEPHLARLNNHGKYNAWSTEQSDSWIQVDFLRPVVISQVATQGAKQMFQSHFVVNYTISYSNDRRKWFFYKGDSRNFRKMFTGNEDAYQTKTNTFFPPLVGRFIRLHPFSWYNKATVRMEFYGCELDGCSVPLGMENGLIKDHHITASSTASIWYSGTWKPSLARLNTQGTVNAWQARDNDMHQWLRVELPQVTKITGIITQGAKSLGKEMYVISYALQYSDDGIRWNQYSDDEDYMSKTFIGNTDNNGHVKNYIYPPIFSRFIRIIPKSWKSCITMRIELLGCDFE
ncbi:coagulation factor V [Centroberyx affinis]|uniref:coagulation factor V n=1 Tax=Centroberyx affinis TaxID=166261 RepID=UPI003A5BC13D